MSGYSPDNEQDRIGMLISMFTRAERAHQRASSETTEREGYGQCWERHDSHVSITRAKHNDKVEVYHDHLVYMGEKIMFSSIKRLHWMEVDVSRFLDQGRDFKMANFQNVVLQFGFLKGDRNLSMSL